MINIWAILLYYINKTTKNILLKEEKIKNLNTLKRINKKLTTQLYLTYFFGKFKPN